MVKANTYGIVTPTGADLVWGTDKSDTTPDANGETVNFLLSEIFSVLGREKLTANRTYYVDPTSGSDANDGLSSGGGAFATITKALNTALSLDSSIHNVAIQLADDTYTENVTMTGSLHGSGAITIQGNSSAPANVVWACTSGTNLTLTGKGVSLKIKDLKVSNSGGSVFFVDGGYLDYNNLDCGAISSVCFWATGGGKIYCSGDYEITGNQGWHWYADGTGIIECQSRTVTLTGTPVFSGAFANATILAGMILGSNTFSGGATGTRYSANLNAVIATGGGGAAYLPGDAAGSTAAGGQYA